MLSIINEKMRSVMVRRSDFLPFSSGWTDENRVFLFVVLDDGDTRRRDTIIFIKQMNRRRKKTFILDRSLRNEIVWWCDAAVAPAHLCIASSSENIDARRETWLWYSPVQWFIPWPLPHVLLSITQEPLAFEWKDGLARRWAAQASAACRERG